MIFIRSLIFQILFYTMNLVLCVGLLWCLLLPRDWAFKILYHCYFRPIGWLEYIVLGLKFEVIGAENIPKSGSYIIAMKHQSAYETLKMFHIFGDTRIMLKKQLAWIPMWGWYALKVGMIKVDRGRGKIAVQSILKNAEPVIKEGIPILIYPQGTRVSINDTVKTRPYKQGVMRLYEHFDIPILPVAMNSGKFWRRHKFVIKPGTVTFKIMPPIVPGLPPEEAQKKMVDMIESESIKLL